MQHEALLNLFCQRLLEVLPLQVRQLILFGSQARGDATANSDLDLLLLVNDNSPSVAERIRQVRYEVMEQYNFWPFLSLLILDEQRSAELKSRGSGLLRNIEREGITLWAA